MIYSYVFVVLYINFKANDTVYMHGFKCIYMQIRYMLANVYICNYANVHMYVTMYMANYMFISTYIGNVAIRSA